MWAKYQRALLGYNQSEVLSTERQIQADIHQMEASNSISRLKNCFLI